MVTEHHKLDPYPIPREKAPMFVNEPWLIDKTIESTTVQERMVAVQPENEDDNIRIYIPMDLNKKAILRRLQSVIYRYGEANEYNEMAFSSDVEAIVAQIEIYDQIWYVRHMPTDDSQKHSEEAVELVREFIHVFENIPDGCAECFPFDLIDRLQAKYIVVEG